MKIHKIIALACLSVIVSGLNAQKKTDQIYVDNNGVMRWSENKKELHGFGVNYTIPFAHEYRMAQRAGVSVEEAIKQDVYHMARLDLDLYRVHVWDTEISDTAGNLINNDHLRLFDFAINEMKKRGMRFIITPIAYWGNGWPEKDEITPGFAQKYGKEDCLTNPEAIEAQANYLNQFLKHVNTYTGVAYKDDPQIIGFEICNEPHHNQSVEKVTAFINKMVASLRQSGCSKPIFYNMSHSIHLADAYLNANVQGGTFQWYPTNLVANHEINGNFLPHVEDYTIPFGNDSRFKKMAKIVYEFDPADVGGNIMYPAIARTFRESGMQLATQFAYDAMCWAPYNTNYGTHFMNLAYAPQKAISLKITSAIFHNVPLYQKHADKNRFDGFRISYPENLAEWVTNEKFFYSNNTSTLPANLSQLREIAGCGSSPVVKYSGTGAYFLDKLSDGVWRLEVMPDVYWIEDPYSPVNPNKQKAAVLHSKQLITISLPNLGTSFTAKAINSGNNYSPKVENAQMEVAPGVYLLKRMDVKNDVASDFSYKNISISEFVAPVSNLNKTVLWNHSPEEAVAEKPIKLKFDLVSPSEIKKIQVVMSMDDVWKTLDVTPEVSNNYSVNIPAELLKVGFLNYRFIINTQEGITTFPNGKKGDPWSWENRAEEATYVLRLVPENAPLVLWEAGKDWESSYKIWNRSVNLRPDSEGETNLSIKLNQLPAPDPNNKNDSSYAFKYFFGEKIKGRNNELTQKKFLVIKASNLLTSPQPVEIGLCDKNGSVVAAEFLLKPDESIYKISLDSLKESSFLIIPRPFPEFLSYKTKVNTTRFERENIETLQVVIKPGNHKNVNLNIQKIWVE